MLPLTSKREMRAPQIFLLFFKFSCWKIYFQTNFKPTIARSRLFVQTRFKKRICEKSARLRRKLVLEKFHKQTSIFFQKGLTARTGGMSEI